MGLRNPLSFSSLPVTLVVCIVYAATLIPLIGIHFKLPPAPKDESLPPGLNLTEAWSDLQFLSNGFHPYNSRRNDEVRKWLLHRIQLILEERGVDYVTNDEPVADINSGQRANSTLSPAVIFNDLLTNVSFSWPASSRIQIYFESTNIIVYIRGTEAGEQLNCWDRPKNGSEHGIGGVLVNAHYDSVSTGYGATDDGVGVVSILQLISYFTQRNQRPKRGIVALFNNGEEDYLNGAYAFAHHPLASFPRVFLNLEGAGAGGRAALFRSTDTAVTRYYKNTEHPFGTVISADGFKRGFVKSETDYAVFTDRLDLRGLDVAFIEPRSRYHTSEDDARDTSRRALWHMLATAFQTVKSMSDDISENLDKQDMNGEDYQSQPHTTPVWFDIYGQVFALIQLHSLFAISVTLLVVSPLFLIMLMSLLRFANRQYLFTRNVWCHSLGEGSEPVNVKGLGGFCRYPVAFVAAVSAVIGEAFLMAKYNPQIIQRRPFLVWGMMLATLFIVLWAFLHGAAIMRPTPFDRVYALLWIYILFFILATAATVLENNFQVSGVYFLIVYFATSSAALSIAYLELFALPPTLQNGSEDTRSPTLAASESNRVGRGAIQGGEENINESTSLIMNEDNPNSVRYGTDGHSLREAEDSSHTGRELEIQSVDEQRWEKSLPSFLWVLEFLFLAPINIVLIGHISLFVTSALTQTLSDGGSPLLLYLDFAILSILLLLPLSAFVHRITFHLPALLLAVLLGTLTYNLLSFPFSRDARMKIRIGQHVDLDDGSNTVYYSGLPEFIHPVIASLPSASGQELDCETKPVAFRTYAGLATCGFSGLPPNVLKNQKIGNSPSEAAYEEWISFSANRTQKLNEAIMQLHGRNTRACRIYFDRPVRRVDINRCTRNGTSSAISSRGTSKSDVVDETNPEVDQVRLWSREWDASWEVKVQWEADEVAGDRGKATVLEGRAACLWSDANERGTIPAYDEAMRFAPVWVGLTKMDDGLVIGSKKFSI